MARAEHAWLLRAEGLTYAKIADHFNIKGERARQMNMKFARIMLRATKGATIRIVANGKVDSYR